MRLKCAEEEEKGGVGVGRGADGFISKALLSPVEKDPLTDALRYHPSSQLLSTRHLFTPLKNRYQAEIKESSPCELPSDPTHTYQ
ncbi:zinc finger E-box-binding homeobox 2b [Lates japonicus]|uniref:Zinc finger E-box-binding homeobox 2b n=1 Tax=Lates japonicus TaxID=270547 RepID=A0AAD3RAK5_LATJO|nr:zinc finger E-box-binding homeobox 2b [Lates japonicus]